jgi:hypothetical protein
MNGRAKLTMIARQYTQFGTFFVVVQTDGTHIPSVAFDEFLRFQLFQCGAWETMTPCLTAMKAAFDQLRKIQSIRVANVGMPLLTMKTTSARKEIPIVTTNGMT